MNQFNKFKARSFLHKAGKKTIEIESFMKKLDALRYSNHIAKDLRNKGLSVVQQKEVGPRRIYVIKLKKDALKEDEFSRVNPRRIESLPCLYVGQTSNTIESRYLQHLNDRVLGSKWVRRYDDGLAFEFFDMDREFQTELEALEEEERLGLELRKKGYATIWG
jgi:hypothetical protein